MLRRVLGTAFTGALRPARAMALVNRPGDDGFLACGMIHIAVWGRKPATE
jgi:hypothetical protein